MAVTDLTESKRYYLVDNGTYAPKGSKPTCHTNYPTGLFKLNNCSPMEGKAIVRTWHDKVNINNWDTHEIPISMFDIYTTPEEAGHTV
tara:strand:+ start:1400 stop:1663 length:264 start_codon:yes stop_codon:yes gene_type:complete